LTSFSSVLSISPFFDLLPSLSASFFRGSICKMTLTRMGCDNRRKACLSDAKEEADNDEEGLEVGMRCVSCTRGANCSTASRAVISRSTSTPSEEDKESEEDREDEVEKEAAAAEVAEVAEEEEAEVELSCCNDVVEAKGGRGSSGRRKKT